jgi:hypothetical protein
LSDFGRILADAVEKSHARDAGTGRRNDGWRAEVAGISRVFTSIADLGKENLNIAGQAASRLRWRVAGSG